MPVRAERFFPASVDATYTALQQALQSLGWERQRDDHFARRTTFVTPVHTFFSSGATTSGQVVPTEVGATVQLEGRLKFPPTVLAPRTERKRFDKLLDVTSAILGSANR